MSMGHSGKVSRSNVQRRKTRVKNVLERRSSVLNGYGGVPASNQQQQGTNNMSRRFISEEGQSEQNVPERLPPLNMSSIGTRNIGKVGLSEQRVDTPREVDADGHALDRVVKKTMMERQQQNMQRMPDKSRKKAQIIIPMKHPAGFLSGQMTETNRSFQKKTVPRGSSQTRTLHAPPK